MSSIVINEARLLPWLSSSFRTPLVPFIDYRTSTSHAVVTTSGTTSVDILSLNDDALTLAKPMRIQIQYSVHDHDYVAVFPQAGIAMSGDSVREAIDGFKDELVQTYRLYVGEIDRLGPEPRRRLSILEGYIGEKAGKPASQG